MNLGKLGLHEGLLRALEARGMDDLYPFLEKTVHHVNARRESVSAQVRMGSGREFLYLVPLLQWLLTEGSGGRALVILPSDRDVSEAKSRAQSLAEAVGIPVHAVGHDPDAADATASLSMGAAEVLASRQEGGTLDLRQYGFLVADGAERFVESPNSAFIRRLRSFLLPAPERRTLVFSEKLGVKEQTLALDLADAPTELYLEEETEKAKHLSQVTWYVASDSKMRLLLGVLSSESRGPAAVFCNLRENAEEVARRLSANGKKVEYILGNLPQPRKDSILARARAGELEVVALTDEGAQGLPRGSFPLVVNYDIPLEGEPYLERVRFLDAGSPGARIVNFACDRYVYGIPAVEQFMGISLGAAQADESLFAAVDKSAGMSANRGNNPNGRNGYRGPSPARRGESEGRPGGRDGRRDGPSRRSGGPTSRGDSPEYRRDGRGKGRDGDPRNQESIRAGIAELTGVNLGGSGARNHGDGVRAPLDEGAPDRGSRPGYPGKGGRRGKRGRRGGAASNLPRGPAQVPSSAFADPYALPMEERMRLYKEKYGKHLAENAPPKSHGRKKGRRRRGGASGTPSVSDESGLPGARTGSVQSPEPSGPAIPRTPEVPREPDGEATRGGLIGRLFGGGRKDQES